MSETDKLKDEIKRTVASRKMKEEVDKMRPDEVRRAYIRLMQQGKVRK